MDPLRARTFWLPLAAAFFWLGTPASAAFERVLPHRRSELGTCLSCSLVFLLLVFSMVLVAGAAQGNLVGNGSFEDGTPPSGFFPWNAQGNVAVGNDPARVLDGVQWAGFNGGDAAPNGSIEQTIDVTAGQRYRLSFLYGKYYWGTGDAAFDVTVTGAATLLSEQVFDTTGGTTSADIWNLASFYFVADQTTATLEFADASSGGATSFDAYLDAVRVDPITVSVDWVTVGDPGNDCETQSQGCFGAVAYTYQIGKYEVTNAQYAAFLNAVAATDTNGLYSTNMGLGYGGITRSGSSGGYTYSPITGREDMPVNYVSFYDALRFANWLHNGQPTGAQDGTTTEDGAYDMSLGDSVVRKAGAQVFLPSEDEWYKAAYYDAGSTSYFDYPAGSDTQTTCATPGATANTANCALVVSNLTDVGSYTGSASPSGTFDQGGNVWEWNEALIGSNRGLRGGGFNSVPDILAASGRYGSNPADEINVVGFRVASPGSAAPVPSLSPVGVALLGGILLGIVGLVRRRG